MPPRQDVTGQKFGCSFVIEYEAQPSDGRQRRYVCRSDCGKVHLKALCAIKKKTCECEKRNAISNARKTHGQSNSPEYLSWQAMKSRCLNPNSEDWQNYGGRGITICERWLYSFENFLEDMKHRPSKDHSLDRKDNDKNYEPNNCRWATKLEQILNRRNVRLFTFNGETLSAAEWGRRLGGSGMLVTHRLDRGWDYERAFTTKAQNYK